VDEKHGPSPEYPDVRPLYPATKPASGQPEHAEHDLDRIAAERSLEDQALHERRRSSWWRRLFLRTG
jgi:hypothetical protein